MGGCVWLIVALPSGIISGKFLERGRIAKPKAAESDPSIYYLADELYVGSKVEFNRHQFVLVSADEYALRYLEKHPEQVRGRSILPEGVVDS